MSFECRFSEITDRQRGAINLSTLFELSEARRSETERPRQPVALAKRPMPIMFDEPTLQGGKLVLKSKSPVLPERRRRTAPPALAPLFTSLVRKKSKRPVRLPSPQDAVLAMVKGTGSRMFDQLSIQEIGTKKVRLPFFLDRYVPASLLKQLAGQSDDLLLRKDEQGVWQFVEDDELVDLADPSITYSLGPVEMYS